MSILIPTATTTLTATWTPIRDVSDMKRTDIILKKKDQETIYSDNKYYDE